MTELGRANVVRCLVCLRRFLEKRKHTLTGQALFLLFFPLRMFQQVAGGRDAQAGKIIFYLAPRVFIQLLLILNGHKRCHHMLAGTQILRCRRAVTAIALHIVAAFVEPHFYFIRFRSHDHGTPARLRFIQGRKVFHFARSIVIAPPLINRIAGQRFYRNIL